MILRLPFPSPAATTPPDSHRVTSQCLEIAGWSHDDCVEGWCRCACHTRQAADLAARLRAYREQQQARLDAGPLGRHGTTNRALDAWRHITNSPGGVRPLAGRGLGEDPALPATTPRRPHTQKPRSGKRAGTTTEGYRHASRTRLS